MNPDQLEQLRELRDLQERMNRFFDEARARETPPPRSGLQMSEWHPAADVYEKGSDIIVKMDLPSVDQQAITLKVHGNQLEISGERRLDPDDNDEHYLSLERPRGLFSRSFAFPETIDREGIRASCESGVLTVYLPRRTESEPRTINVEVK